MYCMKCGSQIPDNSEFCDKCGTKVDVPLEERGQAPEIDAPPASVKPPSYTIPPISAAKKEKLITPGKIALVISVFLIAILAIWGIVSSTSTSSSSDVDVLTYYKIPGSNISVHEFGDWQIIPKNAPNNLLNACDLTQDDVNAFYSEDVSSNTESIMLASPTNDEIIGIISSELKPGALKGVSSLSDLSDNVQHNFAKSVCDQYTEYSTSDYLIHKHQGILFVQIDSRYDDAGFSVITEFALYKGQPVSFFCTYNPANNTYDNVRLNLEQCIESVFFN